MYIGEVPPRPVYKNKKSKKLKIKNEEQNYCIICNNKTQNFYAIDSVQKFICDVCANSIMLQRASLLIKK